MKKSSAKILRSRYYEAVRARRDAIPRLRIQRRRRRRLSRLRLLLHELLPRRAFAQALRLFNPRDCPHLMRLSSSFSLFRAGFTVTGAKGNNTVRVA